MENHARDRSLGVCNGVGVPKFLPSLVAHPSNPPSLLPGCQLGGEVRTEGAYLSQAGDEEVSALNGCRHLTGNRKLQEST